MSEKTKTRSETNMKLFVILGVLAVTAYAEDQPLMEMYNDCMKEKGLDKEKIKEMKESNNFQDIHCLAACLYEKLELLDEDGKFNEESIHDFLKNKFDNKGLEYTEDMKQEISNCVINANDVKTDDKCERAEPLYQCWLQFKEHFPQVSAKGNFMSN